MNTKIVHSDIQPNNSADLATRYLDVPNMPWEPTKFPGIQIKVLYADDDGHDDGVVQARTWRDRCRCTSTRRSSRLMCLKVRSRITKDPAVQVSSAGARPAICTRPSPQMAL